MNKELLIVSVYPEFTQICTEVCAQMNIKPIIIEAVMNEALDKIHKLVSNHATPPKVIIARGATSELIQQKYKEIIVLRAEPDGLDLLKSYIETKSTGKKTAFLVYPEQDIEEEINIIKQITGLDEIKVYTFISKQDIKKQVANAKNDGIEILVGGGLYSIIVGREFSLPIIFVKSSKKTIRRTIDRAINIIETSNRRDHGNERFRALIASINDGIISLDEKKRILLFNHTAEKIFNKNKYEVIGRPLYDILPNMNPILDKCQNIKEYSEEIFSIGDKKIIIESILINENSDNPETMLILQDITKINLLESTIRQKLKTKRMEAKYNFNDIITKSSILKNTIENAKKYAATDETILITGETGTGKELFAHSIHNYSKRSNEAFIAINCSAIPEHLLESELFGYEEGSFTGAKKGGKSGLFESAHGGTIFLDEINSLAFNFQSKILRIIQDKEVLRVGSDKIISIDVRVLAATNKNLIKEVEKNLFRDDLFYRISTLNISIPSLRERKDDIPLLANHFIKLYSNKYNKQVKTLSNKQCEILINYTWHGNIRELENTIKRYVVLFDKYSSNENIIMNCLSMKYDFEQSTSNLDIANTINIKKDTLANMEREIITNLLRQNNWKKSQVAELLEISRATLWRKLKNNH